MSENESIQLSVRLMAFNHADYILEALEGIDRQKTDFVFELVIGDDFSTDNTLSLIKQYKFQNQNLRLNILDRKPGDSYSIIRKEKGRLYNFINILNNCRGEFIALLDGDDYWTDESKLQQQVDYLKGNSDYAICFHPVSILVEDKISGVTNAEQQREEYEIHDLLENNFIYTASAVFRAAALPEPFPEWYFQMPIGDWPLHLLLSQSGKIHKINSPMAAYRTHVGGIWSKRDKKSDHLIWGKMSLTLATHLNKEVSKPLKKEAAHKFYLNLKHVLDNKLNHLILTSLFFYYRTSLFRPLKHLISPLKWVFVSATKS